MAELTSAERVLRVLRREEPDRVPHFEWIIDHRVREAILPGTTMEEFTLRMGLDAILTAPDIRREQVGPSRWRTEYGVVVEKGGEEHVVPVEGPIKTLDDLRNYEPPDPRAPGRFESLKRLVKHHKGKVAIGVHLNDVFSIPRALMGFQDFLMALVAEPELARGVAELSVELNIAYAKECARLGADFVFTGDDYAATEGPMMSPKVFRELLYPGLVRVFAGFKEAGLMTIKHSDGNIRPILDMILDAKPDCLDPIDPAGGLDMGQMKQQHGDRLALKGNVDCIRTLPFGSMDEVVRETKEVIRKAAHGGGLIVSSSNSIHSQVKPENYLAMWNTVRTYGTYPIKLDPLETSGAGPAFG
ncbi:MAG: uroporphyrinogen decarboxylase family protein [Planctomycetota bacterium]